MFEQIRHQLTACFTARRTLEDKTHGLLIAKAANQLQVITNNRACRYRSEASIPGVLFEVKSLETHRNYIVNLAQQTCTCSIWQSSGYPCGHAISILLDQKEDPQRYVKPSFTIAAYKKIYEQALLPLDLANVNGDAIHSPPTLLYQTTRIQNLKMIQSYLPPLVVPLEGQGSAESVVSMMKLIVKNACSGVRGVVRLGTHGGPVMKQLMGQLNCF